MEKADQGEGSGGDENDRVESDPQNTYLQVRSFLAWSSTLLYFNMIERLKYKTGGSL